MAINSKGQFMKGNKPANFIGRWEDSYGYVCVYAPDHPFRNNKNMVKEHRLKMEKHIGRFLHPKEVVHHINGIKNDNRLKNLILLKNQGAHLLKDHPRRIASKNGKHQKNQYSK